jgi:hypothetical protein
VENRAIGKCPTAVQKFLTVGSARPRGVRFLAACQKPVSQIRAPEKYQTPVWASRQNRTRAARAPRCEDRVTNFQQPCFEKRGDICFFKAL